MLNIRVAFSCGEGEEDFMKFHNGTSRAETTLYRIELIVGILITFPHRYTDTDTSVGQNIITKL